MTVIGNALLRFSLVSLIAGIIIAFYIYNSPWANRSWEPVQFFMYAWMGFPHIAAIAVLFIPFIQIHRYMKTSKQKNLLIVRNKIKGIRKEMLAMKSLTPQEAQAQFNLCQSHHEILQCMYAEIERTNDWPINLHAGTSYAVIYILSSILPVFEIWQVLNNVL